MNLKILLLCVAAVLGLGLVPLLPGAAPYAIALLLSVSAFFVGAIAAFYWAVRNRQFQDFEQQARMIFDDDEPEGRITDFFPDFVEAKRAKGSSLPLDPLSDSDF